MRIIDIEFDYRKDSKCGDPDADSQKLYEVHRTLWSKQLPSNEPLVLDILNANTSRILLKNSLTDNLSSDRMCPHFVGIHRGKFDHWLSQNEKDQFRKIVRTIGGHIVFPAHKKDGFTINQGRGVNRKIGDRFDLTLECIRRFYQNEHSPLFENLKRYSTFFELFVDFDNYVDFFLLNDFTDENYQVKFSIPFDGFNRSPFPQSQEEYRRYKDQTIQYIQLRNSRIKTYLIDKTHSHQSK